MPWRGQKYIHVMLEDTSQIQKVTDCMILFIGNMSRIGESTERAHRWVTARGWGRREWGVIGSGVSLRSDGNVLELGRGGVCTTLRMY